MSLVKRLVREASEVDAAGFVRLVENVVERLKEERRVAGLRNFRVVEGLVELKTGDGMVVVGDIHGDLESLTYILEDSGFPESVGLDKGFILIFLGDYGDRGEYSPEVYHVVLSLKEKFPDNVVMLRGNHEGPPDLLAVPHDLPYHLKRRFSSEWEKTYDALLKLFEWLPHSAVLKPKYLFLHGGIPSGAESLEDLAYAYRNHPAKGFLEEILWNDPEEGFAGVYPSPRGAGRLFGPDVTERFLGKNNLDMLIRGHEPCSEGFKLNHNGKVLTLFSRKGAPYYNTYAAYLKLEGDERPDGYSLASRIIRF